MFINLSQIKKPFLLIKEKGWAKCSYSLMYFGFCFYILFFPLGNALREIGIGLTTAGMIPYYIFDYKNSQLKYFRLKYIYLLFWTYMLFKVFNSINIHYSWYGFETNIRKGFLLFFAGIECVRNKKDLKLFVTLFCIMGFYEGLDGIYQYVTGFDFVKGTAIMGSRLTGSLSTCRIGNLMSLVLPPSMGIYFLWDYSWSTFKKGLLTGIILTPALFLFIGAQTRSGYVGYFIACIAMLLFFRGFSWIKTAFALTFICSALFFGPARISYTQAINGPRIQCLWPTAIKVFKHDPILGVGINGFNQGFKNLGLRMNHGLTNKIPHPHNIYLQLASETGIIGLGLFIFWVGSYLWWSWKKIRRGRLQSPDDNYWALVLCFWAAFLGYLGTAISAHNFFRTWWLGMALSILGITIGACLAQIKTEKKL